MGTLVKLKNAIITTLLGAPGKSVKVDVQGLGKSEDDAELYHSPGILSRPQDDTQGIMLNVNGNNIIIATHDYKIDKSLDKGELLIYSVNASGTILSSALLNDSGEFVINDGARSAAAFDKLKEGFDELKSDFNTFVTTIYNTHNHPTAPVGPVSIPSVTGSSSTASVDDAEVPEVLLP